MLKDPNKVSCLFNELLEMVTGKDILWLYHSLIVWVLYITIINSGRMSEALILLFSSVLI